MKYRQTILVAAALMSLTGYAVNIATKDTLPKAANRLGEALLSSNTDVLWTFMREDEQAFYGYDKVQFAKFWNELIAPKMKEYDSYLPVAQSNGLEVVLRSSRPEMRLSHASLLISGQLGTYKVPSMVAFSCINAAATDPKETRTARYVRLEKYVHWFDDNRSKLQTLGLSKIKRLPGSPGETLDELRQYWLRGIAEAKGQTAMASR